MLIEPRQCAAELGNRLVVPAVSRQLFRITLPAGYVAADARFVLVAAQVRPRIHRLLEAFRGALGGAAAEQLGEHLHGDVGERTGYGEQDEHPDPEEIAAGLDDVHDQECLDDVGEDEEGH